MKRLLLLVLLLCVVPGCSNQAPPNLTPQATAAFYSHRVQRALDLIRDTVQDGFNMQPPVFSLATARKVTIWHKATVTSIHATQNGWQAAVDTGLDELLHALPETESRLLHPYATLAKAILKEVIP